MGQKKYSSMGKCMHDWKKDHPKGKGKVSNPHKQAIAVCMSKTEESTGISFKDFLIDLYERTYGGDASHREALMTATLAAQAVRKNALIAIRFNKDTKEKEYLAIPPGKRLPAGYEIWAEVTPRGKIRRLGDLM